MAEQIDTDLYQDVGALKADVRTLDKRTLAMDEKLDRVLAHIEREKGAKRTMATVGTVGGSIAGAVFGAFVSWFTR